VAFAVGDCSKPLETGEAARDIDENSVKLLKDLFRAHPRGSAEDGRPWRGWAAHGFDIVSCQFAIHYFFEHPEKLDGFLNNVSNNLKSGGRFITTFMDGDTVDRMLTSSEKGIVDGRKGSKTVWAIIKSYDVFSELRAFGKVVNVYLENTNQLISEYLVKFDLLVKLAEAKGLELVKSERFDDTFNVLDRELSQECQQTRRRLPYNKLSLYESICELKKDPVQTQFSFVNRWAIFEKK
jgi:SAM-dependent methyltransferase